MAAEYHLAGEQDGTADCVAHTLSPATVRSWQLAEHRIAERRGALYIGAMRIL